MTKGVVIVSEHEWLVDGTALVWPPASSNHLDWDIISRTGEKLAMEAIHQSLLPLVGMSHEFIGADHGGVGISFFLVIGEPGQGPRLHKHNYDEIVYVISGQSKWIVGNKERDAVAGDVLIVRAGEPHKFVCSEVNPARQIDIHLNPTFETVWLE